MANSTNQKFLLILILAVCFNEVVSDWEGGGSRWGSGPQRRTWGRFPSGSQQQPPQRPTSQPWQSMQPPTSTTIVPITSTSTTTTTQRPSSSTSPRPTLQDFRPPRYQFPSAVTQPGPPYRPPTPRPPTQRPPGPNRPAPPLQGRPQTRYVPTSSSQPEPTSTTTTTSSPQPQQPSFGSWRGGQGGWTAPPQNANAPPTQQPSSPTPPTQIPPQSQPSMNSTLNPYRHNVTVDPEEAYHLVWVVDWSQNRTIFNLTVQTTGWIGFGFSRRTFEAFTADDIVDIIIGGVHPNGSSYFTDRHDSLDQDSEVDPFLRIPPVDSSQDWILHDSWERGGQTFLSFSRPFDTCDPENDIPITEDSLRLIWAYGETDVLGYHDENRGVYDAYLLMPDLSPLEVLNKEATGQDPSSSLQVFNMTSTLNMPVQETTYWCTWHKAPTVTKHHIIGFDTVFPTDEARRHVHHLLIHRCIAPAGVDPEDLFGPPSRTSGSECYYYDAPNKQPMQYCRETMHVWGVGGRSFFLPDHVGLMMSENGTEFILLQVHYDNPEHRPDLNISVTLQAFYTSDVREHDVSMLGIGQNIPAATSIIVPPMSRGHATVGICPSACTEKGLGGQEVNIIAGWLHTHTTGMASRFMHLRGDRELPWIITDDNWNFNFQQFRVLSQERRLVPGDRLIARCEYDSTRRNGSAVVGGFGTYEAMCTGHVYYYPRQAGFSMCRSVTRDERYWDLIKVRNATWDTETRQVTVTDPPEYAGLTMRQHVNMNLDWTPEFRRELQMQHLFVPQVAQCPNTVFTPDYSLQELNEQAARQAFTPLPPDPNSEHDARNPRNIPRYRKPPQCSARSPARQG